MYINLTHDCVLELLKLSSTVNECKPQPIGRGQHGILPVPPHQPVHRAGEHGRGLHSSTFQLNLSRS